MPGIDDREVRHVASLARIELDEEEVARLARELEGVLSHMDRIAELDLDTDGRGPEGRSLASVLRSDEPNPDPMALRPADMAPDWRSGFFVVPRLSSLGEREAP